MSGSKLLRLCCLFLSLLLLVPSFSVVANASTSDNLLINDCELINFGKTNSSYYSAVSPKFSDYTFYMQFLEDTSTLKPTAIFMPFDFETGIPYTISFTHQYFNTNRCLGYFGIAYLTDSNDFEFINANEVITLSYSTTGNAFSFEFVLPNEYKSEQLGFVLYTEQIQLPSSRGYCTFSIKDFSVTAGEPTSSMKLDGILGWLEDIKNSIVGLPETIKTNLSSFFTDLSNKLTELKNNIKTNLETLGNNVNGKLGDVSTDFSGYITNLGDRISDFFSELGSAVANNTTELGTKMVSFKNWVKTFFEDLTDNIDTFFTNLENSLISEFTNLKSSLSSRFDKVDNFLTEIRDFFHNLYWDLVGGTCGAGDVHSSLFERLGDRIRGFFEDLKVKIDIKVEEIKTSIYNFFVPPEGFFDEYRESFNLMLSENLGIIYTAVDFTSGLVEHIQDLLDNKDEEISYSFPAIEFDVAGQHIVLFENETPVDFSFLYEDGNNFSQLYGMYEVILRIILIFALIGYAWSVWKKMIAN